MLCNVPVLNHEYGRYICPALAVSLNEALKDKFITRSVNNLMDDADVAKVILKVLWKK